MGPALFIYFHNVDKQVQYVANLLSKSLPTRIHALELGYNMVIYSPSGLAIILESECLHFLSYYGFIMVGQSHIRHSGLLMFQVYRVCQSSVNMIQHTRPSLFIHACGA